MKINSDFIPINNSRSNASDELYSCNYINTISDNITSLSSQLNNKENKITRGTTLNLSGNVPYLVAVKCFSTISKAGGVGIVLGGYDIYWIHESSFSVSRSGSTYNFTSGTGTPYAMAIRLG